MRGGTVGCIDANDRMGRRKDFKLLPLIPGTNMRRVLRAPMPIALENYQDRGNDGMIEAFDSRVCANNHLKSS